MVCKHGSIPVATPLDDTSVVSPLVEHASRNAVLHLLTSSLSKPMCDKTVANLTVPNLKHVQNLLNILPPASFHACINPDMYATCQDCQVCRSASASAVCPLASSTHSEMLYLYTSLPLASLSACAACRWLFRSASASAVFPLASSTLSEAPADSSVRTFST